MKKLLLLVGGVCLFSSFAYAGDGGYNRKDFVNDMFKTIGIIEHGGACYQHLANEVKVADAVSYIATDEDNSFFTAYKKITPELKNYFYADNLVVFEILNTFLAIDPKGKDVKRHIQDFNAKYCNEQDKKVYSEDFKVEYIGYNY